MEDKCPKCGNFLITKTIKKELGHGSIDYPVSQMCPKCNWSRDLTGAGDIAPKPLAIPEEEIKKEAAKPVEAVKPAAEPVKIRPKAEPSSSGMNTVVIVVLAIFVIAVLAWVFLPPVPKQASEAPTPTLTPIPTPATTGNPATTPAVVITNTPVTEVTPTGVQKWIQLDSYRIFRNDASNIQVGDKVTWKNIGNDPFTLLSKDIPDFGEKLLDNDKITSYIFKKPGTYGFYLKNNENLNGTIIVEP